MKNLHTLNERRKYETRENNMMLAHDSCRCFCLFMSKWIFHSFVRSLHFFSSSFFYLFVCANQRSRSLRIPNSFSVCALSFCNAFSFDTNHLLAYSHKLSHATERLHIRFEYIAAHVIRIIWIKSIYYTLNWHFCLLCCYYYLCSHSTVQLWYCSLFLSTFQSIVSFFYFSSTLLIIHAIDF